ncbi:glycosyl hydrolase family 18 protein [Heyndrickxia acidicola]|uniref:Glycosyl hydrolase family 18 protein n=1 Tax=Heyndrickxia acidicola TaxID=209389 RepID=A0ABU6MBC3_9BACI|nr:glycosyl hydrolase family 18 protein [Heyndrickxia acidicola]MED1201708.1 glycosyl hydrolase family 18 protein [Heyndrickxia acidicola]
MANIQLNETAPRFIREHLLLFAIIFFISILCASLLFLYPFASNKKVPYFTKSHEILVNSKLTGQKALLIKDQVYLPVMVVQNTLGGWLYPDSGQLIMTTNQDILRFLYDKNAYYINDQKINPSSPLIIKNQQGIFLSIDVIKKYYPFRYQILKSNGAVWIEQNGNTYFKGKITTRTAKRDYLQLRTDPSLQAPYTTNVIPGESIRIEKQVRGYDYIRRSNGIGGYIKADIVDKLQKTAVRVSFPEDKFSLPSITLPIQLSWEAVYSKTPDTKELPRMPGVTIVSPTWFQLKNENGELTDKGDSAYCIWARKQGYTIWPLFSNAFNPQLTKNAFNTFVKRQKIITSLLAMLEKYQSEGLNLDIENVNREDGPLVTEFVREAAARLHRANKIVSMNITFKSKGNWSEFYERHALSESADYLIVMAYDEHTKTIGSVASIPWVRDNVKALLKEVPGDRLILGIPLYTRLWKENTRSGEISSAALTMNQANQWVKNHKLKPDLDNDTGQYYIQYIDKAHNEKYSMWLEDDYSLRERVQIAELSHLAGIAVWSRYFANEQAWASLKTSLAAYHHQ